VSGVPVVFRDRLLASCLAGALLAPLALVVVVFVTRALGGGTMPAPVAYVLEPFLRPTGWIAAPLFGGALGAIAAWPLAEAFRHRAWVVVLALVLAALGALALGLPAGSAPVGSRPPQSRGAIARSILKWSYRSPATVALILPYARHADATVREQAVLALGDNLIVRDLERASERWPAKYAQHPLRGRLEAALLAALEDSSAAVRAEAARALWNAPKAFGVHRPAAETLAAVLDRAADPKIVERLAWLALDGAAGPPDEGLRAAVARFAQATPDSDLARAAREVLERWRRAGPQPSSL
jgi:hypothetical protein